MVRVDVAMIMYARGILKTINSHKLEDIQWHLDGEKAAVDPKIIRDFKMTGLSNCDFVDRETGELFNGFDKEEETLDVNNEIY